MNIHLHPARSCRQIKVIFVTAKRHGLSKVHPYLIIFSSMNFITFISSIMFFFSLSVLPVIYYSLLDIADIDAVL